MSSIIPSSSSSFSADPNLDLIHDNLPPEKDPRNSIVLAVSWVPAFSLSRFRSEDWNNFWANQLRNPDRRTVLTSIHACFVLDQNNQHKWRKKPRWMDKKRKQKFLNHRKRKDLVGFKERERSRHYRAMKRFLLKEKGNFQRLHSVWGNLKKWRPISYDPNMVESSWHSIKNQFSNIIDSYIKHGESLGMTLEKYVEFTLDLNEKVDAGRVFQDFFKFPKGHERFSFVEREDCDVNFSFAASSLARCFTDHPNYGKFPKLDFLYHNDSVSNGYGELCYLSEIKFRFDVHFNLINHHVPYKCERHGSVEGNHNVFLLSHMDRLNYEAVGRH